jgi:hypothetical protein
MSICIGKKIEVTNLNKTARTLGIIIHLECSSKEIDAPHIQDEIVKRVRVACNYLRDEGFLPENADDWKLQIAGVAHARPL